MTASPSSRPIVLDDTDLSIRYSGSGWFVDETGGNDALGNFGPTYMHTLHGTRVNGQIAFNFSGTSILIIGTNPSQNISNPMVDWECFIDGSSIGRERLFPYPENNWGFCQKENLSDTLHSFTMDVQVKSSAYTFWFDQLQYTPSANVPRENSTTLVGNDDPTLQYDSSWGPLGGHKATSKTGATVLLNFTGTSVSWYGYTPTEFPHASGTAFYSIDGGGERQFTVPGLPDKSASVYNRLLFAVQGLRQGQHSLRVTYSGPSNTAPLTLGHLLVESNGTPTSGSPSPTLPASSESVHDVNVGPIVGGVVGGVAMLFFVVAAILWTCRRKARPKMSRLQPEVDIAPFAVAPSLSAFPPPVPRIVGKNNLPPASVSQAPSQTPIAAHPKTGVFAMNQRANAAGIQPVLSTIGATNNPSNAELHVVQHQDSGLRAQQIDIPPHYTPT